MSFRNAHLTALKLLPKNTLSRAFGVVSEVEFPTPVQRVVNRTFAQLAGIAIHEAGRPLGEYASLNALFTRTLKDGARSIEGGAEDLVSPVDGRVGAFGTIEEGTLVQAKGREYRLIDLVDSAEDAEHFYGGSFLTIYLSPRDYHRIHAPVSGELDKVSYIPGQLFPVHDFAVANIDRLFAINERLITYFQTQQFGRVGLVKVGATCVGRIGLSFDDLQTNQGLRRRDEILLGETIPFSVGDELALFNLGSTVVILVESPNLKLRNGLQRGEKVKMGELLSEK